MGFIKLLSAPLIGAVIGYCTNYIAVKMLFRPLRPIKVFGKTLPFTPGIIPKRKPALARGIAQMVGTSLMGEEEIAKALSSKEMKEAVVTGITEAVNSIVTEQTIKEDALLFLDEEGYDQKKAMAAAAVTDKVVTGIASMDISELIVKEGTEAIRGLGGMVAMFVNENMIRGFAGPISERFVAFLETEGRTVIQDKVSLEFDQAETKTIAELFGVDAANGLKDKMGELYDSLVAKEATRIASAFDVCGIVETKINEMDVEELEQLILSVMKNELGMIVNLGALIGFVLGLCNLFF